MTQLLAEGFATYGTGIVVSGSGTTEVGENMLSGVWAELPLFQNVSYPIGIDRLPWDPDNPDLYLYRNMRATNVSEADYPDGVTFRRVLAGERETVIASCHFALSFLPSVQEIIYVFCNSLNTPLVFFGVDPAGRLWFSPDMIAFTYSSAPVIVAQTSHHIELKVFCDELDTDGTIEVRVDEVTVMPSQVMTQAEADPVAMIRLFPARPTPAITRPTFYITDFIVRDDQGDFNNDFMGDRKVATLFVSADDPAHQGWTPNYLRRFGNGVLDLTAEDKASVSVSFTTTTKGPTNPGSGDFTMEANVRFADLPASATKAVLWGKWDTGASNRRQFQIYKGGPALAAGATVFQISTDGLAGTAVQIIETTAWEPVKDTWYHVCVERVSGVTTLYVDGVPLAFAADANAYYDGTAPFFIGAEAIGTSTVQADTSINGWMDELRLTIGTYRYGAPFSPPTDAFPRGGLDADWAYVGIIYSFDDGVVADESSHGYNTSEWNDAVAITPEDGDFAYQTMAKDTPFDHTFIQAAFLQATGVYTLTGLPSNGDTVTLATTDGATPAVYTWKTTLASAYDVKIGATAEDCLNNLAAAIVAGSGAGSIYGTGTLANNDVTAAVTSAATLQATAIIAGTAGNALASTETGTAGSWGDTTLNDGEDIPDYSQFNYDRLPSSTTVVDSVTLMVRAWKSDAGDAQLQASFVGGSGGVDSGADRAVTTVPTVYFDMIETDPDSPTDGLSPTVVARGKIRLDRTV